MIKQYLLALYGSEVPINFPAKSDYNSFLFYRLGRPLENDRQVIQHEGNIEIALPYTKFKNIQSHN
jgi:hypothetical protein